MGHWVEKVRRDLNVKDQVSIYNLMGALKENEGAASEVLRNFEVNEETHPCIRLIVKGKAITWKAAMSEREDGREMPGSCTDHLHLDNATS